jgi:hypothetical protein
MHSAKHAFLRLTEHLSLYVRRAFDKVWITGLISELIKAGIPAQFTHTHYTVISITEPS